MREAHAAGLLLLRLEVVERIRARVVINGDSGKATACAKRMPVTFRRLACRCLFSFASRIIQRNVPALTIDSRGEYLKFRISKFSCNTVGGAPELDGIRKHEHVEQRQR